MQDVAPPYFYISTDYSAETSHERLLFFRTIPIKSSLNNLWNVQWHVLNDVETSAHILT